VPAAHVVVGGGAETLQIEVTAPSGPATEYVCDDPDYPEQYRPKPQLELPIVLTLLTGNGALDARIETVLVAESGERAEIPSLELAPEVVGGELGKATAAYYQNGYRNLIVPVEAQATCLKRRALPRSARHGQKHCDRRAKASGRLCSSAGAAASRAVAGSRARRGGA